MPEFVNYRSIGPDTDHYERIETARKAIGKELRVFFGDETLPLKALKKLHFGARCELHGGDSFSYTFTIATTDELALEDLFNSGGARTIALNLYDMVARQIELHPSALIRVKFNSWEWLKGQGISSQTLFRNGDDRYEHQLIVDPSGRLYAIAPSAGAPEK